jgi:hypothetical protein
VPLASWLFIRGQESIWVERPFGSSLVVAGPGARREQRNFISDEALNAYQVSLAETLTAGGWFLWGVDRDRRSGAERRTLERDADRRQRHAGSEPRPKPENKSDQKDGRIRKR